MQDWFQDVLDFHQKCGVHIGEHGPKEPLSSIRLLRKNLIAEEVSETLSAVDDGDLAQIADGIVDLIYVLIGTAISYGIDIRPIWDAVHASNMQKVGGPIRGDGKVLKPKGWTHPNIAELLINNRIPLGQIELDETCAPRVIAAVYKEERELRFACGHRMSARVRYSIPGNWSEHDPVTRHDLFIQAGRYANIEFNRIAGRKCLDCRAPKKGSFADEVNPV